MSIYFGFALADSMFQGEGVIERRNLTTEQVRGLLQSGLVESCCNPSHQATITAMRSRFGLEVEIPSQPPQIKLFHGDAVIVMGVRGLPRLTDRHEYTESEVASATFVFTHYFFKGVL